MENENPESLGRYQIVRELGHGAMGIVYEGLDPNIGRRVAIKTARRDVMESSGRGDEMMERFLREARAAGALNHPNIITIFDADEEESGIAYIAMEFLDGRDLLKIAREKRRFEVKDAVEVTATVCEALAHAHEHGVIHRDVKPSNIIVLNNGQIKVADFGIARVSDSNLTQEGVMIGTPHYMSPEQFMGHTVDARSDLFSVGIILYELLTGEKPFPGEALSTVMHNVVRIAPIEPRELNFAVNECLSKVVMKALNKDPNQRYQNGNLMAAALRESLKENPDSAVTLIGPPTPAQPVAETVVASGTVAPTVLSSASSAETIVTPAKTVTTAEQAPPGPPHEIEDEKRLVRPAVPPARPNWIKIALPLVVVVVVGAIVLFLRGGGTRASTVPNGGSKSPNYYRNVSFKVYLGPTLTELGNMDYSTVEKCNTLVKDHKLRVADDKCKAKLTSLPKPKNEPATTIPVPLEHGVGKVTLGKGWQQFGISTSRVDYFGGGANSPLATAPAQDLKDPIPVVMAYKSD